MKFLNKYPQVLSEQMTLDFMLKQVSISRYGDGEFKLCRGNDCVSQRFTPKLGKELRHILRNPIPWHIVGIPNIHSQTPKADFWHKFIGGYDWTQYLNLDIKYFSSFITRPDSAPWIDTSAYWSMVTDLWRDRDVVLVRGSDKGFTPDMLSEAKSVKEILCPRQHAYDAIDEIEQEIGENRFNILSCGAMATCLAYRLTKKGMIAWDTGHVGMFMRRKFKENETG